MTHKWTDELIESELKKCIDVLKIDRMPTAAELIDIGRNDLHCKIGRTKTYSGWAEKLGLKLKSSDTTKGNQYEFHVLKKIKELSGYQLSIEKMTTKHPYDLLINGCVKVDVKVGKAHYHFDNARAHTFRLSKKHATCDIYVCVALDENDQVENYFIIPAAHVPMVTLNMGSESKYNKYKNNWNFLFAFVGAYEKAIG